MNGENDGAGGIPPPGRGDGAAVRPGGASGPSGPSAASGSSGGPPPAQPRPPVLRYVPGTADTDGAVGPGEETTRELPPGYATPEMFGQPARPLKPARPPRPRAPLIILISLITLAAVVAAALFTPWRDLFKNSSVPIIGGCADGTPCQAANAYLAAYTGGDYEAMYKLVSAASRARFGDKKIIGSDYADAHDYIVNRTKIMLGPDFADVTEIQSTSGDVKQTSGVEAGVPVHLRMISGRVGSIEQDITIPLVSERGKWLVDWSPGLVFATLDDPSDPYYKRKVRFKPSATAPTRGAILDRDGNALAKDDTVYDVCVVPNKITNEGALLAALGADLAMDPNVVKAAYQSGGQACPDGNGGYRVRTISQGYYNAISAALGALVGVRAPTRTARTYPYGVQLAPVTGYVQLVSAKDESADAYYTDGDVIGRTGVEAWGERYLRPTKGGTLYAGALNADGVSYSVDTIIASRQAANGADVHTTIKLADQQAAYGMLQTYQSYGGGAFAADPVKGEVLVMASYPACDPNDFSLAFGPGIQACTSATDGRQLNRALQSAQPIGSSFKVVTLSAYIEHGGSLTQTYQCGGDYTVPGTSNVKHDTLHSPGEFYTATDALKPSCDRTFWAIAVGLNAQGNTFLSDMAKGFGFGSPTDVIGVPDGIESQGLVPDPDWLKKTQNGATWTAAEAADLGIGQGAFLATPAQVAMAAAAVANNGARMQPRLVTSVTSADGIIVDGFGAKPVGKLPISPQNLTVVQNAMQGPTGPGGTAYSSFRNFSIPVAGKTGTAETPQPYPHSWFMSFAPATPPNGTPVTPQIATGVLVEHSTYGEICAVPMTLQIMRAHFGQSGNPDANYLSLCKRHWPYP